MTNPDSETPAISADLMPIQLDPAVDSFQAGGHTYHVERQGRLSIARDRWLEKFSLYALLGRDAMSMIKEVKRAYEANNNAKPGDVAVILDNLLKGAGDMMSKEAPLYYVCTLFINRSDEDRRGYDLELGKQKIADWEAAGIDRDFFLSSALSYLTITGVALSRLMASYSGLNLPQMQLSVPSGNE